MLQGLVAVGLAHKKQAHHWPPLAANTCTTCELTERTSTKMKGMPAHCLIARKHVMLWAERSAVMDARGGM